MSENVRAGVNTMFLASNWLPKLHSQWCWHVAQQPNKLALIKLNRAREYDNGWSVVAVCSAPYTRSAIRSAAAYLLAMHDSWDIEDQELLADDLLGWHFGSDDDDGLGQ